MKVNVKEIDEQIAFLREQATRLENLAEQQGQKWAEGHAKKMRRIAEVLLEVRRDSQMTTMSGKRLEG